MAALSVKPTYPIPTTPMVLGMVMFLPVSGTRGGDAIELGHAHVAGEALGPVPRTGCPDIRRTSGVIDGEHKLARVSQSASVFEVLRAEAFGTGPVGGPEEQLLHAHTVDGFRV